MKIAVAAIVKNEASTLLEWIAYHQALGITDFIIADNGSTDGTWEMLKKLRKAGVRGFRFRTLAGRAPQLDAYQRILRGPGAKFDVLAFIDADEYLAPADKETSLLPLIDSLFSAEDVSAVALNWACFGTSGKVFRSRKPVFRRFLQRAEQSFFANQHFKSLVRPERVSRFYNPHEARLRSGRYIRVDGRPLVAAEGDEYGISEDVCWVPLRVNHYVLKSLEDFLVRKSPAGSAAKPGKTKHHKYFVYHDRNDVTDRSLRHLEKSVALKIAHLEALVGNRSLGDYLQSAKEGVRRPYELCLYWLRRLRWYGVRR